MKGGGGTWPRQSGGVITWETSSWADPSRKGVTSLHWDWPHLWYSTATCSWLVATKLDCTGLKRLITPSEVTDVNSMCGDVPIDLDSMVLLFLLRKIKCFGYPHQVERL